MAGSSSTAAKALQKVEERLSCSVCLENFTQPKFLPCHHAFCQDCLGHLPHQRSREGTYSLNCPVCRRPAQLPEDGISGFPNAFHVSDLIEVRELLIKLTDVRPVTCDNCDDKEATGFCQQCQHFLCQKCIDAHRQLVKLFAGHEIMSMSEVTATASELRPVKPPPSLECSKHKTSLSIYCHTCDQLICRDCTIRDHKGHEYDPISDESIFATYKQEIESNLQSTKQRLALVMQAIKVFNKRTSEIADNRDRVKQEIRATGEQIIAAVRQSMGQLEKKADTGAEQKLRFVSAQMEDAQTTAAMLQSCVEYVEEELRMGSQQQILAAKRQMVARMNVVTSQVNEEEYSLTEEPNIKIIKNAGKNTVVGEIELSMLVDKCKVSGRGIMKAIVGQNANLTLAITPTPGSAPLSLPTSLISCQLSAPEAACPTDCNITETAPGKYEVSYTPVTSGPHQLRVQVGNVDIPGSPFTVQIKMRGTPLRTIQGMNHPFGVAVGRDGSVVVTECTGHCVTVLDKEGKKVKSFGSQGTNNKQFQHPDGVVITRDNKIIVSDESNHRIQKFDMEGRFGEVVGSQGNGQLQFQYPCGIIADKNNKLLVADSDNHRIQVMNSDLTFSHTFGVRGSQPGQFQRPCCIAIDSKGMVYVTDNYNHRVQKFTPEGAFVAQFGKMGTGEGELVLPRGIAIDTTTDTVYVSSNHKVSMLTTDGKYIGEFGRKGRGEGEFHFLHDLAVDESTGDLYVCDTGNDRIVVY